MASHTFSESLNSSMHSHWNHFRLVQARNWYWFHFFPITVLSCFLALWNGVRTAICDGYDRFMFILNSGMNIPYKVLAVFIQSFRHYHTLWVGHRWMQRVTVDSRRKRVWTLMDSNLDLNEVIQTRLGARESTRTDEQFKVWTLAKSHCSSFSTKPVHDWLLTTFFPCFAIPWCKRLKLERGTQIAHALSTREATDQGLWVECSEFHRWWTRTAPEPTSYAT